MCIDLGIRALFRRYFNTAIRVQKNTMANQMQQDEWRTSKQIFISMKKDEKRKVYKCKEYYQVADIPDWINYVKTHDMPEPAELPEGFELKESMNDLVAKRISLFRGDITSLEVDAIVNAANKTLLGGGGVDGSIHRGAGKLLLSECKTLGGCEVGNAKITGAYELPADYVIHTVGPIGEKPDLLKKCYSNSMNLMSQNKLHTIAFPCISTGIYGYPAEPAAHVAASVIRSYVQDHHSEVRRVIFCVFLEADLKIYEKVLHAYFPVP